VTPQSRRSASTFHARCTTAFGPPRTTYQAQRFPALRLRHSKPSSRNSCTITGRFLLLRGAFPQGAPQARLSSPAASREGRPPVQPSALFCSVAALHAAARLRQKSSVARLATQCPLTALRKPELSQDIGAPRAASRALQTFDDPLAACPTRVPLCVFGAPGRRVTAAGGGWTPPPVSGAAS
jgi:hypothetical protein